MLKKLLGLLKPEPAQRAVANPMAVRGRIGGYLDETNTGNIQASPEPKVTMHARVIRADGTEELVELDATVTR